MGVLISLQPPTGPMEVEAASAGFYTHKNVAAADDTFRKAPKAKSANYGGRQCIGKYFSTRARITCKSF